MCFALLRVHRINCAAALNSIGIGIASEQPGSMASRNRSDSPRSHHAGASVGAASGQTRASATPAAAYPGLLDRKLALATFVFLSALLYNQMQPSSPKIDGLIKMKLPLAMFVFFSALLYKQIQPPPPKIPGSPGGPPVTATRTKLRDGRHLAYLESGVPKENARYKIIFVHGFGSCRYDVLNVSEGLLQELGIYLLSFDRPGYGESDAHPGRTEESIVHDIAELADNLRLGPKFHLIGFSMGGEIMWSCLRYIPHRLSGVAILAPVGNYWWPGLPPAVSRDAWYMQFPRDRRAVWVAHHLPWLTHWWNTQRLFPSSSVKACDPAVLSKEDATLIGKFVGLTYQEQITQQGEHESLHRDMIVGFGKWSWSPLQLEDPFAGEAPKVHLWHGVEDLYVPVALSRYISEKLPWVIYHELPTAGHLFPEADGMPDVIVRSLLLRDDQKR